MLIHPFDHVDIVAGQGTCGLEILEQCPDVKTVVVADRRWRVPGRDRRPRVKALRPDVRVVGVQAEGAAAYPASLAAGRPGPAGGDGHDGRRHRGRLPGRGAVRRHPAVRRRDRDRVSEESLSRALLLLLERAKLVVEPAGAAAVAAMLDDADGLRDPGGRRALGRQRRPAAADAGRSGTAWPPPAATSTSGPASPTCPAAWPGCSTSSPASRPTSSTSSTSARRPSLHLDEVEVQLQVETRGAEHAERVLAHLRELRLHASSESTATLRASARPAER